MVSPAVWVNAWLTGTAELNHVDILSPKQVQNNDSAHLHPFPPNRSATSAYFSDTYTHARPKYTAVCLCPYTHTRTHTGSPPVARLLVNKRTKANLIELAAESEEERCSKVTRIILILQKMILTEGRCTEKASTSQPTVALSPICYGAGLISKKSVAFFPRNAIHSHGRDSHFVLQQLSYPSSQTFGML